MVPEEPVLDSEDIGEEIEHDDEISDELDVEGLDDLLAGVDPDAIEEPDDGTE